MSEELESRVKKVIKEVLGDSSRVEQLGPEQSLNSLGITSVNFIKIILVLEDEFDIQFDDEDLKFEELDTIRSVAAYIDSKL